MGRKPNFRAKIGLKTYSPGWNSAKTSNHADLYSGPEHGGAGDEIWSVFAYFYFYFILFLFILLCMCVCYFYFILFLFILLCVFDFLPVFFIIISLIYLTIISFNYVMLCNFASVTRRCSYGLNPRLSDSRESTLTKDGN